jgi:hypothetical protein
MAETILFIVVGVLSVGDILARLVSVAHRHHVKMVAQEVAKVLEQRNQ